MMVKTRIEGETHFSRKDKRALKNLDLSRFDAIFLEDYQTDYFERKLTVGYVFFAIGHLLYGATFGRLYFSHDELRRDARRESIPIHGVDADVDEMFEMVPWWERVVLLPVAPIATLILLGMVLSSLSWLSLSIPVVVVQASLGFLLLLFFGFLWALMYFLLLINEIMADRDEYMANEVMRLVDEGEHQQVLINCGDKHRPGIAKRLEEAGHTVEEYPTRNRLGRAMKLIEDTIAALFHPIRTIGKLVARVR